MSENKSTRRWRVVKRFLRRLFVDPTWPRHMTPEQHFEKQRLEEQKLHMEPEARRHRGSAYPY